MRGMAIVLVLALAVPASAGVDKVELVKAKGEVPESRLLDVALQVFDPGIPEGDEIELERKGIYASVRRAEARLIPLQLRQAMQGSGHWGAVRVVGGTLEGAELTVTGRILAAGGKHLHVELRAVDATGKEWMERRYKGQANPLAYRKSGGTTVEPFQALYNEMANDLAELLAKQDARDVARIREVARLRFARQLAPHAFEGYLKQGRTTSLVRLPAAGDPMAARADALREREGMLVDTLDEHYSAFALKTSGSYDAWRKASYDEQDMLDRARRSRNIKGLLGVAAIIGGAILGAHDNCNPRYDDCGGAIAADAGGQIAVLAGTLAVQSAMKSHADARMHAAALKEMAMSLDAEMAPILVEVEGRTRTLEGNAETQYAAWRSLLAELFAEDTGAAPVTASQP
jgi:hypothetical protein